MTERPTPEQIASAMRSARLAGNPQWWWLADEIDALRADLASVTAERDAARADAKVLAEEMGHLTTAKRYDGRVFNNDTEFADWAISRARHTLSRHGGGA